jgi:aryl-alcohol dehydrogenase-like predicted oxidoreductase/enamine deaminase RidA (YjgF/YER057c/UK114 family)
MNPKVERCELAHGFSISRVLTGLWQIADMERDGRELDQEATAAAMAPYLEAGFTTFDMADHYGSAEEIAGLFRRQQESTETVQLLTKWVPKPGACTKNDVRAAMQRALDRVQSDALDVLQFHAWNYADPSWLDALFWLQELKEEGLIRHMGLTNFDAAHLQVVVNSGIEIVSNQVCFSLLDQRPSHGMTEVCLQHGIKLLAFGTVAGGFLTERWLGKTEPDEGDLETWSEMKYRRFIREAGDWERFQNLLRTVEAIAHRHSVSMANVACRYILDQPAVGGIIIGARLGRSEHLEDNLRLFQSTLDEKSQDEIKQALAKMQPIPGNSGDEYRKPPFLTASGDLSHHLEQIPPPYVSHSGADGRSRVLTGTPWEAIAGFSRAVRHGNRILVSGTTATHGDRPIGGNDPAAQLHFVIDKIQGAIESIGGQLEDVVRTRVFIRNVEDWEPISRVHGERFRHIQPANTLVRADLIGDEYLVEMEADAITGKAPPSTG